MDNCCCKNYIIRRTEYHSDGSSTQVHVAEFDKKKEANNYILKQKVVPNIKYEIINNCWE